MVDEYQRMSESNTFFHIKLVFVEGPAKMIYIRSVSAPLSSDYLQL